jgi:lipopolysaccharide export system protein LptC
VTAADTTTGVRPATGAASVVRRVSSAEARAAPPPDAAVDAREAARRRAHSRYSRFVGLMKVVLPTLAVLLIVLVTVWPNLRPEDLRFRIGFSSIETNDANEPSIINPRYFGTDRQNQAFSVTADIARNIGDDALPIELEMPKADIALEDGTWLVLTSETGAYTRADQALDLAGAVNLYHDSGFEFRTETATIDLAAGVADGVDPVQGQGPFGRVEAEGFRLIDKGRIVHFKGDSKLVIYPAASRPLN